MLTSLYYGHWDYWNLGHKVTFDGENRLIRINEGVTELDMQIEVYSDWKEWVALENNLKWYPPFSTVGGEPTVAGQRLDVTYFLINGWKFKPFPGQYNLTIVGNVFDIDGGDIKVPADVVAGDPNNITININTSVIVRQIDSGGSSSGSFDPDTIVSASLFGIQEAALYNIEDRVIAIESILQSPLTASLVDYQSSSLGNIEDIVYSSSLEISDLTLLNFSQSIALVSLLDTNFSQSIQLDTLIDTNYSQSQQLDTQTILLVSQSSQLNSMDSQLDTIEANQLLIVSGSEISDEYIREIWELHGLDITKPLTVTQTGRVFGTVDQDIVTIGTGSAQVTTITRN
jgi:hypothetical protein